MGKFILSVAPVLAAMSGSALAAVPAWKVSEVSGDVRLIENGRARGAVKGALLGSGSTIATGANARAVIVRGEEFVVISPRTQLRVPAATAPNRIMQLIEDFGTAVFKIQKKNTPHFGVQTPYLAAVVKGTTFTVTVGPEGGSVQVTEGAVQVSTLDGGAAELVRSGSIAMVGASDLYRLNVEGDTSKAVRSPNAPADAGSKAGPSARSAAYSGPPGQEVRITKRLDEHSKSLKEVTKGLLEGHSSHNMAQAEFREQARAARKEGFNPGNGDGNGNPGKDHDAKPSDPSKPADEGKKDPAKPVDDGKDKPADDGKDKPVDNGKDKPADDGKDKPVDNGKDKPADDGKDKPADNGKDKPADNGKDKPADDGKDKGDKGKDD